MLRDRDPCNTMQYQQLAQMCLQPRSLGTRREVTPKVCSHSDKEIANAEKMQCPQGPFTGLQSATMSMFS